jgi:hypothetical protein
MRIDLTTGDLTIDEIIEPSTGGGGFYGWWGTNYRWSPDGQSVAWIRADSIGLIDLETNQLSSSLLSYSVFSTSGNWSWRSSVSWSPNSALLAATVHGAPLGSEAPETSPAFDIAVTDVVGSFAVVVEQAGMRPHLNTRRSCQARIGSFLKGISPICGPATSATASTTWPNTIWSSPTVTGATPAQSSLSADSPVSTPRNSCGVPTVSRLLLFTAGIST